MSMNNRAPSELKNKAPQNEKKDTISNVSVGPWTFGYPQCVNKKESRLVCLHKACQKYPFFCSACQDQSCENEHQHKDRITSIGFKELIKRLIIDRKPPENLQKSVNAYKEKLGQLLKGVTQFVQKQITSMDQILKKSCEIEGQDALVVQKLKDKKYQEIKGKELDSVWNKLAPTEHKKKLQKQTIQFIDSKRVEVQEMTSHFREGIKSENDPQNSKGAQKAQSRQAPSNNSKPKA